MKKIELGKFQSVRKQIFFDYEKIQKCQNL
jgi:hypothetical protein